MSMMIRYGAKIEHSLQKKRYTILMQIVKTVQYFSLD